jgi:hypothetical protein
MKYLERTEMRLEEVVTWCNQAKASPVVRRCGFGGTVDRVLYMRICMLEAETRRLRAEVLMRQRLH